MALCTCEDSWDCPVCTLRAPEPAGGVCDHQPCRGCGLDAEESYAEAGRLAAIEAAEEVPVPPSYTNPALHEERTGCRACPWSTEAREHEERLAHHARARAALAAVGRAMPEGHPGLSVARERAIVEADERAWRELDLGTRGAA